jgi:hypothetical protein
MMDKLQIAYRFYFPIRGRNSSILYELSVFFSCEPLHTNVTTKTEHLYIILSLALLQTEHFA